MKSRPLDRATGVLVAATVLFALAYLGLSLAWPVIHDLRILLYEGFLLAEHGIFPYRDFFDVNSPGALLLFSGLHRITGGAQPAIKLVELLVLAGIAAATYSALSRFGARAGVLAGAVFAAAYLATGPTNLLQREYLCVLPLALSIALVFRGGRRWLFFCGMLAGLVGTIKPPLVICWLPLLFHAAFLTPGADRGWKALAKALASFAFGGLLPVGLILLWLGRHGALGAYLDIARNYYPLYTSLDGAGIVHSGSAADLFDRYGPQTLWLLAKPLALAATLGLVAVLAKKDGAAAGEEKPGAQVTAQAATLGALTLAALLYVPIGGKFWAYHQIPLLYGLSLCAAIAVGTAVPPGGGRPYRAWLLIAALAASLPYGEFAGHLRQWREGEIYEKEPLQVLPLAAYLRDRTSPADTVMPLDTTEAAMHALYLARRPLYGRFLNDFHFYHHETTPYVAGLRRQLLTDLSTGRPSVVLRCAGWRPHEPGRPPPAFPELEAVLAADYAEALRAGVCQVLVPRNRLATSSR